MSPDKKYEPDDKEQSRRFEETARKLGVDESDKKFNSAFKAIASKKVAGSKKKSSLSQTKKS